MTVHLLSQSSQQADAVLLSATPATSTCTIAHALAQQCQVIVSAGSSPTNLDIPPTGASGEIQIQISLSS